MEKIPPWRQNRQEQTNFPNIQSSNTFLAMSSFLDDRNAETPAPIPLECQLGGPETPSPSLPSSSPTYDVDTTDLLRLSFADDYAFDKQSSRKRRLSGDPEHPQIKRRHHRRTKAEIIQDRNNMLMAQIRPCEVRLVQRNFDPSEFPARVFTSSGPLRNYVIRMKMPSVPRMKFVPKDYLRITDIGFMRTKNGIIFSCLSSDCNFKTRKPDQFQAHIKNHKTNVRLKICEICRHQIDCHSPLFELEHLLRVHILQTGIDSIPLTDIFYSKVSTLHTHAVHQSLDDEANDDNVNDEESNSIQASDDELNSNRSSHNNEETAVPRDENVDSLNSLAGSPEYFKAELDFEEDSLDDPALHMLLDEAIETIEDSLAEPKEAAESNKVNEETKIEERLDEIAPDSQDPDFDPNELVESEDEPISNGYLTSEISSDDDSKRIRSSSDNSDDDEALPSNRRRLTRSVDKKCSRSKNKSATAEATLEKRAVKRSKRKIKPSERAQHWKELCEITKKRKALRSQESLEDQQFALQSDFDSDETVSRNCQSKPKRSAKSRASKSSPESLGKDVQMERRESCSSPDIGKLNRTLRVISEPSSQEISMPAEKETNQDKVSEEIDKSKPDSDKENETSMTLPTASEVSDKSDETPQTTSASTSCETNMSDSNDFLGKIPFYVMERIKQSKAEKPNVVPAVLETSNPSDSNQFIVSWENSTFRPRLREVTPTPTETSEESVCQPGLQTARKSTSCKINQLLISHEISECRVMVSRLPQILPKILICNASNPELACVKNEIVPTTSEISSITNLDLDSAEESVPSTEKVSETVTETAVNTENNLNSSMISDGGRVEIEYDESQQVICDDPPLAMKDFPVVYDDVFSSTLLQNSTVASSTCTTNKEMEESLPPPEISSNKASIEPQVDDAKSDREFDDTIQPIADNEYDDQDDGSPIDRGQLYNHYRWISSDISKKCIKSERGMKTMRDDNYLFSTFKCMSIDCSYFTISIDNFKSHLETHRNVDRFFICSYCLSRESLPEDLCEHLEEFHKFDRYQCGGCMYRSCEKFYVDVHRKKLHRNVPIYKLPMTQTVLTKDRKVICRELTKKIDKLVKLKRCERKFYKLKF